MDESTKPGTRIFKKSTPNGKLTIYLGKRDFFDHLSHVDPVEGVVLVDPDYVKDRKVFIHLLGAFRYGHDEVDLMGMQYHSDLYLSTRQVYPPTSLTNTMGVSTNSPRHLAANALEPPVHTRLQERLIRKLGSNAYPFFFQLPAYSPSSVSLNINASDTGKPCRVDYELKAYVADDQDDNPQKRNSVRMVVRKLTYAPEEPGPQPSTEIIRDFLMSLGSLRVEVSLDKQKYHHGETMCVNVLVDNNSSRTVKRIKLSVRQYARVLLHTAVTYKNTVAEIQSEEGFPITPSQTGWCKVFRLCPLLARNRDKTGLAMDGDLKHEDTNLASSTIEPPDRVSNERIGISVQYKVKVRLILGFSTSDVCLQLPFILTHPNPNEENGDKETEFGEVSLSTPLHPPLSSKHNSPEKLPVQQQTLNGKSFPTNGTSFPAAPEALCVSTSSMVTSSQLVSAATRPRAVVTNGSNKPSVHSTPPPPLPIGSCLNQSSQITSASPNHKLRYSNNSSVQSTKTSFPATDLSSVPPLFSGINANQLYPSAETQANMNEDDLLFEDFARFRLQSTAFQHNVINEPKISS